MLITKEITDYYIWTCIGCVDRTKNSLLVGVQAYQNNDIQNVEIAFSTTFETSRLLHTIQHNSMA